MMQSLSFLNLGHQSLDQNLRRYFAGLFLLFCVVGTASATLSKEDKLKAAYLLNFTKFIEWPAGADNQRLSSISICVDESDEFIAFLSDMAREPRFENRDPEVKPLLLDDTESICNVMYVTSIKNVDVVDLKNVIIVVNSRETYVPGAAIVFYEEEKKLRFEVDLNYINSTEVKFSSELLKLARIRK